MTEESETQELNLIEYEEFVQTESTNRNNAQDLLFNSGNEDVDEFTPTLAHQVPSTVPQYEIVSSSKNSNSKPAASESFLEQQGQKMGQSQISASPLAPSRNESREDLFEEKILHMQNIINAQREQLTKKDDKIQFLLTQISELNQHIQQKTHEASSIRVEFAQIQQELECLKQQQRIKEEIQNGESKILEVQIKQEEKIIFHLDKRLIGNRSESPKRAACTKIEVSESKRPREEIESIDITPNQYPEQLQQCDLQEGKQTPGISNQSKKFGENLITSSWNTKTGITKNVNSQQKADIRNSSSQIKNSYSHTKNAMSNDYIYKRDLNVQITEDLNEQTLPFQANSKHFSKQTNTFTQKRSSSNHVQPSTTYINTLANKENKVKDFQEKYTSLPPTQTSSAKPSSSKSTDAFKKGENYREQYIKNIEELQQRLDFLKKKRVEYEIKKPESRCPQSSIASGRIEKSGNLSNNSNCHIGQSSISSKPGEVAMLSNPNNYQAAKLSENTLMHFAQIKKIDQNMSGWGSHKESYFNKQIFQSPCLSPSMVLDEYQANKCLFSSTIQPQIALPLYENYLANRNEDHLLDARRTSHHSKISTLHPSHLPDNHFLQNKDQPAKQFFPLSTKHKYNNVNELSLQDTAYISDREIHSPLKVNSTRNSQKNLQRDPLIFFNNFKSIPH